MLDAGSYRLLPLLHRNLQAHGVTHPVMAKFKGVRRRTWYRNQLARHKMVGLLRVFHTAGICTLALKGAALLACYYRDDSLRPMLDFDILVPTEAAAAAITLLQAQGWMPKNASPAQVMHVYRLYEHSFEFTDGSEFDCDLHWHVLHTNLARGADADFWQAAVPLTLGDQPTLALNAADQLLHTCAHAAVWNAVPPFHALADVYQILQRAPDLDWSRLVDQCRARDLVLPIREMLAYMHRVCAAPVPATALQALEAAPVARATRVSFAWLNRPEPQTRSGCQSLVAPQAVSQRQRGVRPNSLLAFYGPSLGRR